MIIKNFNSFLNDKTNENFTSDDLRIVKSNFKSDMEVASKDKHDIQSAQEETLETYIEQYPQFTKEINELWSKMCKEAEKEVNNLKPKTFDTVENIEAEILKLEKENKEGFADDIKKLKVKLAAVKLLNKTNEAYRFDFEKWDDTDLNGPSTEIAIDNLIEEYKTLIQDTVEKEYVNSTYEEDLNMKKKAAKAVADLWIEKIKRDLKF